MSSRKMPQRYLYTVHEESGIPSTRTTCKKAKLNQVLGAHCRADLLTECMKKKKKNIHIIRRLSFSFFGRKWMSIFVFILLSAVNAISFSSAFSFRPKWKIHFRSASSIHHKKVLVLNTRLGLCNGHGLESILKSWSWCWVLKKSLDYITD